MRKPNLVCGNPLQNYVHGGEPEVRTLSLRLEGSLVVYVFVFEIPTETSAHFPTSSVPTRSLEGVFSERVPTFRWSVKQRLGTSTEPVKVKIDESNQSPSTVRPLCYDY